MPDDATSYAIADDQNTLPNARKAVGGRDSSSLVSFLAGSLGRLEGASARAEKSAQEADTMKPPELHEPVQPPEQQTDPIMSFGQPAVWLAAFGSLLTRQPLTTAINAAASAMQATKGQDFEIAKHNMDVWRTQSENAIKLAKFQQDAYKSVIDKAGKDANVASALARTTGAAFKDAPALMVLETEGLEGFKRFLKVRGTQTDGMESGSKEFATHLDAQTKIVQGLNSDDPKKQADALDLYATQLDAAQKGKGSTAASRMGVMSIGVRLKGIADKLRSGDPAQIAAAQQEAASIPDIGPGVLKPPPKSDKAEPLDDATRQSNAALLATGELPSEAIPGWGGAAVKARQMAQSDAIKMIMKQSDLSASAAGEELANRRIGYLAGRRSTTQLTTMLGATRQAVNQLDFNISKAKEEMAKLPSSDLSPVLNAIARGEQRWTGEPSYASLFFYMNAVANESGRILAGGQASVAQLAEGARAEAAHWADIGLTPSMFNSVSNAMIAEGKNRIKNYEDAIQAQRVGTGGQKNDSGGSHPDNDPDGTVRSQGGVKYRKTNGQWLPVAGTE